MLYGYAMEPYNAVAWFEDGALRVVSTAQHPYMVRTDLARVFDLPLAQVRVEAPYLGGGYGTKSYTKVEPLAAVGAWAHRPPGQGRARTSRSPIYTTRADSARVTARTGFDADGPDPGARVRHRPRLGRVRRQQPARPGQGGQPVRSARTACRTCGSPAARSTPTPRRPRRCAASVRPQGAGGGDQPGPGGRDGSASTRLEIRLRNLVGHHEELLPGKRGLDADLKTDLEMVVGLAATATRRAGRRVPGSASGSVRLGRRRLPGVDGDRADPDRRLGHRAQRVDRDGPGQPVGARSRSRPRSSASTSAGVHVVQSDTAADAVRADDGREPDHDPRRPGRPAGLRGRPGQARARWRRSASTCAADEIEQVAGGLLLPDGHEVGFAEVVTGWFGADAGEVTGIGTGPSRGCDPADAAVLGGRHASAWRSSVDAETGVVTRRPAGDGRRRRLRDQPRRRSRARTSARRRRGSAARCTRSSSTTGRSSPTRTSWSTASRASPTCRAKIDTMIVRARRRRRSVRRQGRRRGGAEPDRGRGGGGRRRVRPGCGRRPCP